ncbi:MAG: PepSY domain-containing protein [Anaerolineae bacterium]
MARKWWLLMLAGAVVLALALAAGVGALIQSNLANSRQVGYMMSGPVYNRTPLNRLPQGRLPNVTAPTGQRITLDQAMTLATQYVARYGANLRVAEVMEFSDNFYAPVTEVNTGRGAFEVLIDPYTGAVGSEPGPNMMWNLKYRHMMMGNRQAGDNTLTMVQARAQAQQTLDNTIPGAQVEVTGHAFYGYYTFDYQVNGNIAGMLSVNGTSGDTWLHTWHGTFISEKEMGE